MNYIFQLTQMTWSLDSMPNASLYVLTIPYDAVQLIRRVLGIEDEEAPAAKTQRGVFLKRPGKHTENVQNLRDEFERYVGENQDEIAQEERWRTTMKKDVKARLDTHERRQMEQLLRLEAQLKQHAQQQSEQLERLMRDLPPPPASAALPLELCLNEHARQQREQFEALMSALRSSTSVPATPTGTPLRARRAARDLSPSSPSKVVAAVVL